MLDVSYTTPPNDIGYERPWLYEKQLEAIFTTKRYSVIEASTKSGKTVGCIVWLAEKAILYGGPNKNFWWVAPVSDQSDIAFRRMKEALPRSMFEANESRKFIKLWNGALIWFKSADKPDSLYGEDVYDAVVDEATRCKDESWHALRSTLTATRGNVRVIGNVKGRANWMYRLARLAQSGNADDMAYAKITAYDAAAAGVIEFEEIENAKLIYPEAVFRELYLAEPGDDGGNPFGIQYIQKCIGPMSDQPVLAWGWDVAKHTNFTVGIGLDKTGVVSQFHRWQDSWDNTLSRITGLTGKGTPALIDSTGSGDQVLERIRNKGFTNFHGQVFGGWKSKMDLITGLVVGIQNQEVQFPEGRIVEELEAFEYVVVQNSSDNRVTYAAPRGFHDDCVDALAMSFKIFKRREMYYAGNVAPILFERESPWQMI